MSRGTEPGRDVVHQHASVIRHSRAGRKTAQRGLCPLKLHEEYTARISGSFKLLPATFSPFTSRSDGMRSSSVAPADALQY